MPLIAGRDRAEELETMVKGRPVDERFDKWQPTELEVAAIVRELRPVICRLARRDQQAIAAEVLRRKRLRALA